MDQDSALAAFAALAHPTRLAVFRLCVQAAPEGLPALRIAERIGVKPSTLSGHLAILSRAELLDSTRHQREIRYRAQLASVNALVGFLLQDCCGGRVEHCGEILALLGDPRCC